MTGLLRVGAASRVELVFHPPVDATRRGLPAGRAAQRRLAEADGQQAGVDAEYGHAMRACLLGRGPAGLPRPARSAR